MNYLFIFHGIQYSFTKWVDLFYLDESKKRKLLTLKEVLQKIDYIKPDK